MPKAWAQMQVVYSPEDGSAEIRFEGPRKRGEIGVERASLDHYIEPMVTAHGKPVVSVGVNADGEMTYLRIHDGADAMLTPYLRGLFAAEEAE